MSNRIGNIGTQYLGTKANNPPNLFYRDRPPTQYDFQNYSVGDLWLDRSGAIDYEPGK